MEKKKKVAVDVFEDDAKETSKKEAQKDLGRLEAELKVLKEENDKIFKEKEELNTKYLLSLAEQKNYKKRIDEENERFYKYATFDLCKEIIHVLDTFDLALQKEQSLDEMKAYFKGFEMTKSQLINCLNKEGVIEIETLGKEFDPNYMISIGQMEDKEKPDQEVLKVFMKGYMYKDRVLRPASVIINQITDSCESEAKEE